MPRYWIVRPVILNLRLPEDGVPFSEKAVYTAYKLTAEISMTEQRFAIIHLIDGSKQKIRFP